MVKLILITLLCAIPVCLKAQTDGKLPTTRNINVLGDFAETQYLVNDAVVSQKVFEKVSRKDIWEITKLVDTAGAAVHSGGGRTNTLAIVTKPFAIQCYQRKISGVAHDYESYLASRGSDKDFIYLIDGKPLLKSEEVSTLYHLNKDNIATVVFTQNEPEGSKVLARVIITTKK